MTFSSEVREKVTRLSLGLMLAGTISLSLAACDSNSAPTPTAPAAATVPAAAQAPAGDAAGSGTGSGSSSSAAAQEVKADLNEWSVQLDKSDLSAGKYTFVTTNDGKFNHNLKVVDSSGSEIAGTPNFTNADGAKSFQVDLKPGTYTFLCDIPGHPEKGMKTDVTVK